MEIELKQIPIRDLIKGYADSGIDGVIAMDGKLNIRPAFQREFVYGDDRRNAVIETVSRGFPLNTMYWSVSDDPELPYEVLDGQQRIISICQFAERDFSIRDQHGASVYPDDLGEAFYDYELTVYFCTGSHREKMQWFKTINIAGMPLTEQEIRNAICSGPWVSEAKRWFSQIGWGMYDDGLKYLNGTCNRQDYLETAIGWLVRRDPEINAKDDDPIELYMKKHQFDADAEPLKGHFGKIMDWVRVTFPKYDECMKGIDWEELHHKFSGVEFDIDELAARVAELMQDSEIKKKSGIYPFVLHEKSGVSGTAYAKYLNLRTFNRDQKREQHAIQNGNCNICGDPFGIGDMQADHIKPWSQGGCTEMDNCQLLCCECHDQKSTRQAKQGII